MREDPFSSKFVAALALLGSVTVTAPAAKTKPIDWPSYNRTLTSDRFAPIAQINRQTASGLRVLCTYDTGHVNAFQPGLVEVGGTLFCDDGARHHRARPRHRPREVASA